MRTTIKYAEDKYGAYEMLDRPHMIGEHLRQQLPGQAQDGYGGKISSHRKIRFYGEKREYRVYITQWSNIGSAWIIRENQRWYLRE